MMYIFDLCEFYNIFFEGILTGIIASLIFVGLTELFRILKFRWKYSYLKSRDQNSYDWIAYSMKSDDGRIREDSPNGSMVNIEVKSNKIKITLNHDNRNWIGELEMKSAGYGTIIYKYTDKHEYGCRDCFIGMFLENGKNYDYIFL